MGQKKDKIGWEGKERKKVVKVKERDGRKGWDEERR